MKGWPCWHQNGVRPDLENAGWRDRLPEYAPINENGEVCGTATVAKKRRRTLIGIVENMSGFIAPDGTKHDIFGKGGGRELAESQGIPFLAEIPLDPAIREGGDSGEPASLAEGDSAKRFLELSQKVLEQVESLNEAPQVTSIVN